MVCAAVAGLRLWGHPAWSTHLPGLLMWASINGALWFCFAWFIAGYSHVVWLIAAYTYGGLLLFHFIISLRPG